MIMPYMGWIKIGMTDYIIPNIYWIALVAVVLGIGYFTVQKNRKGINKSHGFKLNMR